MRTLVLGLGNPLLTDDGVGVHVVRALSKRLRQACVDLDETSVGGIRLLDVVEGYERLILVDAIRTGGKAGKVYMLRPGDLWSTLHSSSSHDLNLPMAIELGRWLGLVVPDEKHITILAIEVADTATFGTSCTPCVQSAIPQVAQMVEHEILRVAGPCQLT